MLRHKDVRQYWMEQSHALAALLDLMDSRENWVQDQEGSDLDQGIILLGERMRDLPWEEIDTAALIHIMAYVHASRALRFNKVLEQVAPESFVRFINTSVERSREEPEANICSLRIGLITRSDMLKEILSKERRQLLIESLKEVQGREV